MTVCTAHVRFRRESRHDLLRMSAFAVAIGGKADMRFCNVTRRLLTQADIAFRTTNMGKIELNREPTYYVAATKVSCVIGLARSIVI